MVQRKARKPKNVRSLRTKQIFLSTVVLCCFFFCQKRFTGNDSGREPERDLLHDSFGSSQSETLSMLNELENERALSKPPDLKHLLPGSHIDGRALSVPSQHDQPFVFTSSAYWGKNKEGNETLPLLFLFTQGTYIYQGRGQKMLKLNITSCLVSKEIYPLLYHSNGLYACSMNRELRIGERLSLLLSPTILEGNVDATSFASLLDHVHAMEKVETGSYVLPSDAFWEGQIDPRIQSGDGRYEVCLMTLEKGFADFLPEWVEYHRKIGVDHVYLYDNVHDNDVPHNISKLFEDRNDVEVVYWPWRRSQIQAQNHFLLNGRRRCEWAILTDVDEYVMVQPLERADEENALKSYLRSVREEVDYSEIRLSSIVLGSSGHRMRPRMPLAESYWHLASQQESLTKPVVWLGHALPDSSIHTLRLPKGYYTLTNTTEYRTRSGIGMKIIHMKFKSWYDFIQKSRRGRNSMAMNNFHLASIWTEDNASPGHLQEMNKESFTDFRSSWRRVVSRTVREGKIVGYGEKQKRYEQVKRKGYAWKNRSGLESSVFINSIIEREKELIPMNA